MKTKELQNFRNKPTAELEKELGGYREKLRKLKFDLSAGKVKNIREIKETKKMIARILTFMNENK